MGKDVSSADPPGNSYRLRDSPAYIGANALQNATGWHIYSNSIPVMQRKHVDASIEVALTIFANRPIRAWFCGQAPLEFQALGLETAQPNFPLQS